MSCKKFPIFLGVQDLRKEKIQNVKIMMQLDFSEGTTKTFPSLTVKDLMVSYDMVKC